MGLRTLSLIANGTVGVTGGTPLAFAEDGVTIPNGLHLMVPSDPNYEHRRQVTIKNRPATLDPKTGQFGKDKKSFTMVQPVTLSDGRVVFNALRIEREIHPSTDAGDVTEFNSLGAQFLTSSETSAYWGAGSLN